MERAQIGVLTIILIISVSLVLVLIVSSFMIPMIRKEMKNANSKALELSLSNLKVEKGVNDSDSINLSVTAANTEKKLVAAVFRFFSSGSVVCIKNQQVVPPMNAMETRTFQILISDCPSFETVAAGAIYEDDSCKSLLNCTDWSECSLLYGFRDIFDEGSLQGRTGKSVRVCSDLNGCIPSFNDVQVCEIDTEMTATKVQKRGREFIEINNSQGSIISRLEYVNGAYKQVYIQFILGDDNPCPEFG